MTPSTHPAREVILVRHVKSVWNIAHRWQGQANPPLSEEGLAQLQTLSGDPRLVRAGEIWSSDLIRAHETAEAIAQRHKLPIKIDPDLRELDVGSWSGKTRDEIEQDQPGALQRYFAADTAWSGGETFEQHAERCHKIARKINDFSGDTPLLIVSHGGTIRMLLIALLGLPDKDRMCFAGLPHGGLSSLTMRGGRWQLTGYGE